MSKEYCYDWSVLNAGRRERVEALLSTWKDGCDYKRFKFVLRERGGGKGGG